MFIGAFFDWLRRPIKTVFGDRWGAAFFVAKSGSHLNHIVLQIRLTMAFRWQIQCWVTVKKAHGDQVKARVFDRHDRPVLWPRHVG